MAYTAWSVVFGEQPTAAKWNQLGANDAGFRDGTNISTGAIKASHIDFTSYNGLTAYTPTINSGFTKGNGTVTGQYAQNGKMITGLLQIIMGSTSSMGSGFLFRLPVTPSTFYQSQRTPLGTVYMEDLAAGAYYGFCYHNGNVSDTLEATVRPVTITGSVTRLTSNSSTSPFTWGAGDYFTAAFQYFID